MLLRPIQPEDEPRWHQFLNNCSERSIWLRFRYLFKESTHEMATRFCFIDYDRTMAIVAEMEIDGQQQLIGTGRLLADADHRNVEYAVLVADAWQGRGLGKILTDYCLDICRTWGADRVFAESTVDNHRLQQILLKRGFDKKEYSANEILLQKQLVPSAQAVKAPAVRSWQVAIGGGKLKSAPRSTVCVRSMRRRGAELVRGHSNCGFSSHS